MFSRRRRLWPLMAAAIVMGQSPAFAEVTGVTIESRSPVAGGRTFGDSGSYEQLLGRIAFALDPADPHNAGIVDLLLASRGADGHVHFSSDLIVLRPTDPSKGSGVALFEMANRGNSSALAMFNRAAGRDMSTEEGIGEGLLMREGYTVVWVGWEFDVPATALRLVAPSVKLPDGEAVAPIDVDVIVNEPVTETFLIDEPVRPPVVYPPADLRSATDTLTVRDRFWDPGAVVPRARWRLLVNGAGPPKLQVDDGMEPGRWYRVTYRPTAPVVAGVGLAAIRDAASAFRYRSDLPIRVRSAYAFGQSQTGRFLRQFLYDGFNVDERNRRVFDAMWVHIAGAARGSYNERFATPGHGDMFATTQFPFADADERDADGTHGGLQSRYKSDQQPKVFYTNTPVEYWAGGRAAALTHTSVDGKRDLVLPGNVRVYLLASTQHLPFPFPPDRRRVPGPNGRNDGQELSNPIPQNDLMRGLLRALHEWTADGTSPPPSRYPRLADKTLVSIQEVKFPTLPGVADPRKIVGPARIVAGKVEPLPHLVPQVDSDGLDIAGIHDPEVAVPLATTTGWNFRHPRIGNPGDVYQTLGAYIPFAATRSARQASGDPRPSLEERYRGVDDYMSRVRIAADGLIRQRFALAEDRDEMLARARTHWDFATREMPVKAAPTDSER